MATKADRISGNQLRSSLAKLAALLEVPVENIIPFSAKARMGHEALWAAIKVAAGVGEPDGVGGVEQTG